MPYLTDAEKRAINLLDNIIMLELVILDARQIDRFNNTEETLSRLKTDLIALMDKHNIKKDAMKRLVDDSDRKHIIDNLFP